MSELTIQCGDLFVANYTARNGNDYPILEDLQLVADINEAAVYDDDAGMRESLRKTVTMLRTYQLPAQLVELPSTNPTRDVANHDSD